MSGRKKSKDKEAIRVVDRLLALSDSDFEKWVQRLVRAGLKIRK